MAGFKLFILIMYVSLGLLSAAVALPLMWRRVAPNSLYGFRVRKTLENPKIWYEANAYAGKCLFWSGLVSSLTCLGLWFVPAIDPIAYSLVCLGVTLVGLAISVVLCFRFLRGLDAGTN